jgi:hypothetical protein
VKWLLKKNYIEDDPTLGSAPYEMNSIAITMEGRLAAESFEPVVDEDAVSAMNRGRLPKQDHRVEHAGRYWPALGEDKPGRRGSRG